MIKALLESFRAELLHLRRAPLFVALTMIQAITFLFLVSLFGLTGSNAPTAIITQDQGPYARAFVTQLATAHHSFDLRFMEKDAAQAALSRGSLVAIITLPDNFSNAIAHGQEIKLRVDVDNVNTDMTDDIQRALPSAIVAFGRHYHFPGIRVQSTEVDLIDHDTGFIPYLIVSGLALDAFIIASILNAMAVAREFETGTIKMLAVAPIHPLVPILGRMLAIDTVASVAMLIPIAIAIVGYHVSPLHPLEMVGVMLLCIAIFGCIGVAVGAILRRTLPIVSLIFGLSFPLYLCSGSLEPQRFDGNLIWIVAHLSPVYYAVGMLEEAFHGLQVTPEPQWVNFVALLGWALLTLTVATILLRTALIERTGSRRVGGKKLRIAAVKDWRWQPRQSVRSLPQISILLIVLVISGVLWSHEQQSRAAILQQQQQSALAASEGQRETRLLNVYEQQIASLIAKDPPTYKQKVDYPGRTAASTLTLNILHQLNPEHKVVLLRYLYKEKLIDDDYRVVSLAGADFHGCNLANMDLSDTDLSGANFSFAHMNKSKFSSSTLVGVNFNSANLTGADLSVTDMHNVDIQNTNLAGADLAGVVGINIEQLLQAHSLAGTRLPDGSVQPGEPQDNDR